MWNKIMLFVSSYIPLYILLICKNFFERISDKGRFLNITSKIKNAKWFDEANDWIVCFLIILTLTSIVHLLINLKSGSGKKVYEVKEVSDETSNYYFNYISVYLLSCLGLTLNNIVDFFVFTFLMLVVGYIYISNNMMYMNLVINLIGYRVYDCVLDSANTTERDIKSIVVAPKEVSVRKNEKITATGKQGFIYIQKSKYNHTKEEE